MSAIWGALGAVSLVLVIDLALSIAIIRRLREVAQSLGTRGSVSTAAVERGLAPGEPLPAFAAVTTDGEDILSAHLIRKGALIAFFAAECDACRQHMSELRRVLDQSGRQPNTLVVVDGDAHAGFDLISRAEQFGQVVSEPNDGPLSRLFRVGVFPTFFVVGDSEVIGMRTHAAREAALQARPFLAVSR